jgi:hypothetical protein
MSPPRLLVKKFALSHCKRELGTIAAAAAVLFMAIGLAASPAGAATTQVTHLATSNAASSTVKLHSFLPTLKFTKSAGVQHSAEVVQLSAAQCRAAQAALKLAQPGAAPMKKCEIGIGLVVRLVSHTAVRSNRAMSPDTTWYTYNEQATGCFGDSAILTGPTNSFSCTAEGYVGISDQFATNGSWLNLHWETPYDYASTGFGFSQTWIGVSGNNTSYMVVGNNWNWSEFIIGDGTMQLRIYNWPCGGLSVCVSPATYWQGV